jgi:hypothetical protein
MRCMFKPMASDGLPRASRLAPTIRSCTDESPQAAGFLRCAGAHGRPEARTSSSESTGYEAVSVVRRSGGGERLHELLGGGHESPPRVGPCATSSPRWMRCWTRRSAGSAIDGVCVSMDEWVTDMSSSSSVRHWVDHDACAIALARGWLALSVAAGEPFLRTEW